MNNDIEAFRFMAIRPPDSSSVDSDVETVLLASDEEIGQSSDPEQAEIEARNIAQWLDEKVEKVDSDDHAQIDSLLASKNLNKKTAVSASVKFGRSAKTLHTLSKHALSEEVRDRIGDIDLFPPLVIDIPKPTIPDEILQKLLNKRKAFFGPVGVGDLMIVEQILAGYEYGEIAHVENVLGFETRSRDHKVRTELDVFTETIEETQKFTETDLQSTERFELKNSIKEEIESQQNRDISHRVNAQYPPYVETESEFNYSRENSKQRSTEKSSNFAREITERAINRSEERIQITRSQRRNIQTEENNHHGFENKTKDNIVGVYRHVDKIYKMRLTRRSPRLFYEFIVPSPGRYLRSLNNKPKPPNTELDALRNRLSDIQPLDVQLEELSFTNYDNYIRSYSLTGIEPPPPPASTIAPLVLTKSILDRDTSNRGSQNYNFTDGEFEVPDGYKAVSAKVTFAARKINDNFGDITAVIARHFFHFTRDDLGGRSDLVTKPIEVDDFEETTGKISFSATARHDAIIGVSFEVKCTKIDDDREKWRVNLYNAIVASHDAQIQGLQTRISELEAKERAEELHKNFGLSPQILRNMEANEIKKICLRIFGQEARQAGDLAMGKVPLAMEPGEEDAYPIDFSIGGRQLDKDMINTNILNQYATEVRFAEQAFEWNNVQYTLYPYFWNERSSWDELMEMDHDDLEHLEFLRAGYARVLVPVRENWEGVVHNFLIFGACALLREGDISITHPLWLALYQEIKEKQGAQTEEFEIIDVWDAKVPTNLVMLDDGLHKPPEVEIPEGWDHVS